MYNNSMISAKPKCVSFWVGPRWSRRAGKLWVTNIHFIWSSTKICGSFTRNATEKQLAVITITRPSSRCLEIITRPYSCKNKSFWKSTSRMSGWVFFLVCSTFSWDIVSRFHKWWLQLFHPISLLLSLEIFKRKDIP